jgi:hypothetical protein
MEQHTMRKITVFYTSLDLFVKYYCLTEVPEAQAIAQAVQHYLHMTQNAMHGEYITKITCETF